VAYPTAVNAVVVAPAGNLGTSTPTHRQSHDQYRSAILDIQGKIDGDLSAINFEVAGRPGTLVAETAGTTKTPRLYNRTGKTWTITAVYPSVDTAPTGSGITTVVRKNGSATGALTATITAAAFTGSLTGQSLSVADGDYLQGWSTAVGSTVAGTDLSIVVVGTTT
jgi:hypothetical protein